MIFNFFLDLGNWILRFYWFLFPTIIPQNHMYFRRTQKIISLHQKLWNISEPLGSCRGFAQKKMTSLFETKI
jgi:hypothetical protein